MASTAWSIWVKWNQNIGQTLADAQRTYAGDESVEEARERSRTVPSVLHTHELGAKKTAGVCWVLSAAELHEHFGSKTPSKKAIEAGAATFVARLGKNESVAVTAYLRAMPCAVMFAGA
jgi:hypothetical protein